MWFDIIIDSKSAYSSWMKQSFDDSLSFFMKQLLRTGALSAAWLFAFELLRMVFFDVFRSVNVNYLRFINYFASLSFGSFFGWVFFGVLSVFIFSVVLNMFSSDKFTLVVQRVMFCFAPILLFGWFSFRIIPVLFVWSVVLWFSQLRK